MICCYRKFASYYILCNFYPKKKVKTFSVPSNFLLTVGEFASVAASLVSDIDVPSQTEASADMGYCTYKRPTVACIVIYSQGDNRNIHGLRSHRLLGRDNI